jgi:hypothetical protein
MEDGLIPLYSWAYFLGTFIGPIISGNSKLLFLPDYLVILLPLRFWE